MLYFDPPIDGTLDLLVYRVGASVASLRWLRQERLLRLLGLLRPLLVFDSEIESVELVKEEVRTQTSVLLLYRLPQCSPHVL